MRFTRSGARQRDLQTRRTRGLVIVPDESHDFLAPTLIDKMIRYARAHQDRGVQLVQTTFNHITIIVAASSDAELILRDYYRAFCGHRRVKIIGPYPEPELPGLEGYTKTQLAKASTWSILRPSPS